MGKLHRTWVGLATTPETVQITPRDLMNFAAGALSERPAYYDDTDPAGIASFPTFCSRISWQAVRRLWQLLIDHGCAPQIMQQQVHYRTEIENHRDFKAGESVSVTARLTGIAAHRAGSMLSAEVSMTGGDGQPVAVERSAVLLRGIQSDAPQPAAPVPAPAPPPAPGADHLDLTFAISPIHPYLYDGCSGIHFPIHSSAAVARAAGLPGIILQGSASLALCVDRIMQWRLGPRARGAVPKLAAQYGAYLRPGAQVRLRASAGAKSSAMTDVNFALFDEDKQEVVKNGQITILG